MHIPVQMTRAAVIIGSARRSGNTEMLCSAVSRSLEDNGIDVTAIRPFGMRISHCSNCGGCTDSKKCVVDDDMHEIYDAISKNDIIILATPVHFSGMSSILKQVIDRFQCLWGAEHKKRKAFALVCHGGSEEPCFGNIVSVSKAAANTIGAGWIGSFTLNAADSGISEEHIRDAYSFGTGIAGFRTIS
jgi:multimeric flavodoxin WrbA